MNKLYTVNRLTPYTIEVLMPFDTTKDYWFMLSSDHHWDNPHCDRELLTRDLDKAMDRGAGIFSFGDLFCAMEGKGDRRSAKNIRPEHVKGNYLDALVNTAAEWYAPYASNIIAMSDGNHETGVKKYHETDMTERLTERINMKTGEKVYKLPYSGWVFFKFINPDSGAARFTVKLYFTHGHGGGGIVTKGTLWPTRKAAFTPDADISVSGHIHEEWYFPVMAERIDTRTGLAYNQKKVHLCLPTYKEEYTPHEGFHIERGRPPKPIGCWFLRFNCERSGRDIDISTNKTRSDRGVSIHVEPSNKSMVIS